uniref:Nuclear pore complex protein Nup214 n=1 Tax=Pygocentrus nattereri TaxID=42514 RepID=A0AAR2KJG7_PYGNA
MMLSFRQDFQFRQMKKIRVFDSPDDLPKERSSLLAISNKFGLTFVGQDRMLKVFYTQDIISDVDCQAVCLDLPMHHLALSSDELTLSVCGASEEAPLALDFYDVRTFFNKARQEKRPFASYKPNAALDTSVQDLKWSPVEAFRLAACLSDGSMMVLDVTDSVTLVAQLPVSVGITCVCWSPKGKQVAAGKQNATVVQYTPTLQEKKVIPCPNFYSSENPVKVLDVLWLSTFNFAVAYAAADGSPETPPELVVVSLPKKDEKREEKYLNFSDLVYGTCTERQHHYFLCHVEDWDLVLAASAASIEVSIIAKQDDKTNWELWVLEDASRGELPVTLNNDDTLPVGVGIDYTSQEEIHLSDEKKLPPAPTLLILSTDGVLCPFSLLNLNPGVKQLVTAASSLTLDGERQPLASKRQPKSSVAPPVQAPAVSNPPSVFPSFQIAAPGSSSSSSFGLSFTLPPTASTAPPIFSFSSSATTAAFPSSSTGSFSFSSSTTSAFSSSTSAFPSSSSASAFPSSSSFSFAAPKPSTDVPTASSFSFTAPPIKPPTESSAAPAPAPQRVATASPITVLKPPAEQIAHFQKEMDELKARTNRADFRVGATEEMRDLRKESEDLHGFSLEIKETTESLHGDISTLKTTLLEGFAGVEEARAQRELNQDKDYLQLLYKKPLDPRSEQQLKEIRRLYQYVKFAVEDVNDVLDLEWEKHLEKKKKQKHMIVPEREALYTSLANNMDIINQQKQKLDQLVRDLQSLRLYNKTSTWSTPSQPASTPSSQSLDNELESLRNTLLKTNLETTSKGPSKSPSKMTPVKQSQLRNFLSKRQTPPVRSTAPANLSRSAFLSPKYYEDLDDVSSTSSLSQHLEPEEPLALAEEEEEPPALPVMTPRHPAVVRTASIQPGFPLQSTPFSRVQTGPGPISSPGINMDSADSTALATKTVKHGPPPTEKTTPTTLPAPQAAARAALNRQMISQKPTPTSLTESTLKTVPQVVNVQELKDKGPAMPVSTVIRSVLFFSNKFPFSSNTGKMTFAPPETAFPLTQKPAPSASVQPPSMSEPVKPAPSFQLPKAQRSPLETLGPFSDLRVGLGEEVKEPPKSFTFGVPGNGSAPFTFISLPKLTASSNGSDPDGTSADVSTPLGVPATSSVCKPPECAAPSIAKPATPSSVVASFSSLLAAPLPASADQPRAPPPPPEPVTAPVVTPVERPSEPSLEPPAESTPSPVSVSEVPVPAPAQPEIPASTGEKLLTQVTATFSVTPIPPSSATPPTEPTASVEPSVPEAKPTPTPTASVSLEQAPPAPTAVTTTAAPSTTPGSIFAPPVATTTGTTLSVTSFTPVISTAVIAVPSSTTVTPLAPSTTAQAPASIFGQPTTATSTLTFGSSTFGAASTTSGFGKPAFGQIATGGFGQPAAAAGSASGFTFGQSTFGTGSGFGQTANAAANTPASSAGGGGLFGSSNTSSASSFSFGASSTSSGTSAGTNLFGQSSAPAFGQQSSGFGQGSLFGGSTTTTTSSGFGFGQPAGKDIPSSGGGLFGSVAGNTSSSGSGFFTGLGGKPSEDAANKNPFGTTTTSGFGQCSTRRPEE